MAGRAKEVTTDSDLSPASSKTGRFSRGGDSIDTMDEVSMTISAPGKVILFGEHSVVYGKLAIAASLGVRTKLTLTETRMKLDQPNYIKVELPDINLVHIYELKELEHSLLAPVLPLTKSPSNYDWKRPDLLNHDELLRIVGDYVTRSAGTFPITRQQNLSLCALFYILTGIFASVNVALRPFVLRVETDLSVSSGSGSSASYSVAIAAALVHYLRVAASQRGVEAVSKDGYKSGRPLHTDLRKFTDRELEVISQWAFASERIMHGAPSGIDNTICTFGSLVEFRKSTGAKPIKFAGNLRLLLIDTHVKRDTKHLVNFVADLKGRYSSIVDHILQAMDEVARAALSCLASLNDSSSEQETRNCFVKLSELTDFNQHLLQALGVSHQTLDRICAIAKSFDLSCKLTGAGGGGYAIVLIPPYTENATVEKLVKSLTGEGFRSVLTDLAGRGVSVDRCNMCADLL